jgi:hypothetical protein
MYEFDTSFNVDTGDFSKVFSGSGVHLNKDVSFSFSLMDHQLNTIENDQQLIENPLINNLAFDILDSGGNVVFPNYLSGGTSRSIYISESANRSIFGRYTKDFGVRVRMSNYLDDKISTGEFYVYGNVPSVGSPIYVSDGEEPSGSDLSPEVKVFDEIVVNLTYQNNLKYINFERYDIYASTGNDIILYEDPSIPPKNNPDFIYSQNTQNIQDIFTLRIKPFGLDYNVPYYFKVVPYSSLGSGSVISFGPKIFSKETQTIDNVIVSSNEFELFDGEEAMNLTYKTGVITGAPLHVIDYIETGLYHTLAYTVEIQTGERFSSSELKLVLNDEDLFLSQTDINNDGQLIYSVGTSPPYYVLYVSGLDESVESSISGLYKIYKTSI